VPCSTDAIESLNARVRRAVRARSNFPPEQAALNTVYLVMRSLDPKVPRARRRCPAGHASMDHAVKARAIKAFAITFADRMPAAEDL